MSAFATVPAAVDLRLSQWLRLLWNTAPALQQGSELPFIAGGGIHLPARAQWRQHCAAAAHAAAHLVYSPSRFDADGLVPIARTLLALLEDARVEILAMRELPGLARLWRPLHQASPEDGMGCEALMGRLSRALADPDYADPHPWVDKGRRLFYLDEALGLPALRTPAELRSAAMRLGHDLGQMRLPFNAKGYRPAPAYRDDHRWMWAADQLAEVQPPPAPQPMPAGAAPDEPPADAGQRVTRHPEWDRLIRRLRPDWATVVEEARPPLSQPSPAPAARRDEPPSLGQRLLAPLRGLARPMASRGRSREGEVFDLDALVQWQVHRQAGQPADGRVYRSRQRQVARSAVWLLVDRSASTAAPHGEPRRADRTVLQAAARSAAAAAQALQTLGVPCAVVAFSSNGRHEVRLTMVKTFAQPADEGLAGRLAALRSAGSTRLGAVLRHATARLAAGRGRRCWVLLLSDGQPHDVDVHDPRYLVEDARHAVREGRRRSVRMACLTLGARAEPDAVRIFGRHATQTLADIAALPQAVRRLVA